MMRADSSSQPRPVLLLVDDDAQIRQLLSEIGAREGFEVLEAADGAAAIEMLQRRHMDLVLLDLHMPRVNGLAVLRAARMAGSSSQIALMSARRVGRSRIASAGRLVCSRLMEHLISTPTGPG